MNPEIRNAMTTDIWSMFPLNDGFPEDVPTLGNATILTPTIDEKAHGSLVKTSMPHKTPSTLPHASTRRDSPEKKRPRRSSDASHSSGQRLQTSVRSTKSKNSHVRTTSNSSSETRPSTKNKPSAGTKTLKSPTSRHAVPAKVRPAPEKVDFAPKLDRIFEERQNTTPGVDVLTMPRPISSSSASSSCKGPQLPLRASKLHHRVNDPLRRQTRANLTSPSVLSVLSSFTAVTSSSSGSNSTVTAKSGASSVDIPAVRPRKSVTAKTMLPLPKMEPPRRPEVDVFNYLDNNADTVVQNGDEWDSETSTDSSDDDSDEYFHTKTNQKTNNTSPLSSPDLYRTFWKPSTWDGRQSFHSDSGISMGEDSPILPRPNPRTSMPAVTNLPRPAQHHSPQAIPGSFPADSAPQARAKLNSGLPQRPAAIPVRVPVQKQQANSPQQVKAATSPLQNPAKAPTSSPTGYGLLATELSLERNNAAGGERPHPLYRKFGSLNHRILLHLQDELVELEEQLDYLDGMIFKQSQNVGSTISPASRRDDARQGGMFFQRTDLMGQIFLKLNQYNQLLASFRSCDRLEGASAKDIASYKAWMGKNAPIVESETRFLDRDADLVRVSTGRRRNLFWYVLHLTPPTTMTAKLIHLALGFYTMALLATPSLAGRAILVILLAAVAGGYYAYDVSIDSD